MVSHRARGSRSGITNTHRVGAMSHRCTRLDSPKFAAFAFNKPSKPDAHSLEQTRISATRPNERHQLIDVRSARAPVVRADAQGERPIHARRGNEELPRPVHRG